MVTINSKGMLGWTAYAYNDFNINVAIVHPRMCVQVASYFKYVINS